MRRPHEEEQVQIARVQRELASLWLQGAGQLWQHASSASRVEGIESLLPSWSTPELVSLEELGAIPSTDVDASSFDRYIAKFGDKIDDVLSPGIRPLESSENDQNLLGDLPRAYVEDPASFSLDDEANWEFATRTGSMSLQLRVDSIDEALFREALKKRKEFDTCQKTMSNLKETISGLASQVSTQRAELKGAFRDLSDAARASVLKRRKENLGQVIRDLKRIEDTMEAIEDMQTVLNDEHASDADYVEVMNAYKSVRESVSDMEGSIHVIDELLSVLTEDVIVERRQTKMGELILDGYRERLGVLKASLRAEKWRHATDTSELNNIATITGGVIRDGKIVLGGRSYGVIGSVDPLISVVVHLMEWAEQKARNVAPLAIEVFRVFNGMTSQLVLGAAAIESEAKLQSITVKHLAIAREQIELASWIALHLVKDVLITQSPEFEEEFDLCLHELDIHAGEIRSKIVSVTVGLIVPEMKNAATAMGSTNLLASVDEDDGIMPYVKDVVDRMLRNFRIVAKVTRASFLSGDADALLEEICAHLSTWLRDAGSRASSPTQVESYRRHVGYLKDQFSTVYASKTFEKVYQQLEQGQDLTPNKS